MRIRLDDPDEGLNNILASNGKSKSPYDFNILEYFYSAHKTHPYIYTVEGENMYYNWTTVKELFNKEFPSMEQLHATFVTNVDDGRTYENNFVAEISEGVVIVAKCLDSETVYFDDLVLDGKTILLNDIQLLSCGEINKTVHEKFNEIMKKSVVKENDNVSIGMVSMTDGEYYVKDFDITDGVLELKDLDLHYGKGFTEFNKELLERMLKETKGLVLFHGKPGSGKTTYVRHLLKTIQDESNKNNILYFPPTMVDAVTDPSFIDFISNWVVDTEGKNYLLIEDAEPLLESRDQSRNIGITNLLNMTDGLLNDILNLQIIATFNTDLKNIDDALLRPERLLGRKSFNNLSLESALELADKINVDTTKITKNMSLADIYSLRNKTSVLVHDIDESENKIGF